MALAASAWAQQPLAVPSAAPPATAWPARIRLAVDTAPLQPAAAAPLALRGVTVIDVARGRHLVDQTVIIVGNRIRMLGPAAQVKVPSGAQVVDARGKYLIPGLWDMHVHPRDFVDIAFPLYLAYGVTGVRDPGSGVPLAVLNQLKREVAVGTRIGPRMVVAGPLIDAGSPDGDYVRTVNYAGLDTHVGSSTPARLRAVIDSLQAAGADFIKTYFVSPEMYFVAAAEARRIGISFGGHGPYDHTRGQWDPDVVGVSGLTLSDSGAQILDHEAWLRGDPCGERNPDSLNVAQCAAAGTHLRRNGTWILKHWSVGGSGALFPAIAYDNRRYAPRSLMDSSALQAREELRRAPGFAHTSPQSTADWAAEIHFADSLLRSKGGTPRYAAWWLRHNEALAQLPVLAGTDVGPQMVGYVPGLSLHNALVAMALGGMTPLAALQAATLSPARALGATDSLGTVAVGKVADLVLLDADPLADIWHTTTIQAVLANGRYFDRPALDRLRAQAQRAAAER